MPYVVFIAAPPVDIMRNMHEFARMRGKVETFKSVSRATCNPPTSSRADVTPRWLVHGLFVCLFLGARFSRHSRRISADRTQLQRTFRLDDRQWQLRRNVQQTAQGHRDAECAAAVGACQLGVLKCNRDTKDRRMMMLMSSKWLEWAHVM